MPRTRPTVYVALTPHGFGHAARTLAILAVLRQRRPEVRLILATTSPRWLLQANLPGEFTHRPVALDVGVVQTDGLTQDLAATRTALAALQTQRDALIAQEAALIRQEAVQLVFGDVPALGVAIAQAAGRPCWMASNFGWDFIYDDWGPEFETVTAQMRTDYGQCDRLFRLPFHEEMTSFPRIEDVGLTAGRPRHSLSKIRETWGLTAEPQRTALLAFGGLGLQGVPYARLADYPDWQFVTFDAHAPRLPNLRVIDDRRWRPVDVMPACGRVITKPGYGTFAEACILGIPIVSLTRTGFAEADLLLTGLRDWAAHWIVAPEVFYHQPWDFLETPPTPPGRPAEWGDGTDLIASALAMALGL